MSGINEKALGAGLAGGAIAVAMLETLVEKNILSVADAVMFWGEPSLFPVNIPQFRRDEKLWQLSESCNMGGSPERLRKIAQLDLFLEGLSSPASL